MAVVGLPVGLKDSARKWADDDTIVIKFSENKEVEELPSVHLGVHPKQLVMMKKGLEDLKLLLRRLIKSWKG